MTRGKSFTSLALLSSAIVSVIFSWPIYSGQISPLIFADYEFIQLSTFVQSRNFSFGGVSFWNPYDQVDFSYLYSVGGLDYISTFAGLIHQLVSRIYPASSFQAISDSLNFGISAIVRAFGTLLLARALSKRQSVQFVSVVVTGMFLSSPMYLGLNTGNLYSWAPVFLAAIIEVQRRFSITSVVYVAVFLTALFISNPLITAGYFYQTFHGVILLSVVLKLWDFRARITTERITFRQWVTNIWLFKRSAVWKIALCISILGMTLLPSVYMLRNLSSHTNLATDRISNVLSLDHYLNSAHYGAPVNELLSRTLLPHVGTWHGSWIFLGFFFVGISLLGMLKSRERVVWVPFVGFLFVVGLQLPRSGSSLGAVFHSLNFFTNPASSLSRSMHMSALLSPWLLVPSFVKGLDWSWSQIQLSLHSAFTRSGAIKSFLMVLTLLLTFVLSSIQALVYVRGEFNSVISVQAQERKFIDAWTIGNPSRHEPVRSYVDLGSRIDNPGYLNTNPIGLRGILFQEVQLGSFAQAPRFYRPRSLLWNSIEGMITSRVDETSLTTDYGFLAVGESKNGVVNWVPIESEIIGGSLGCKCLLDGACSADESNERSIDLWFSQKELLRKELWIDGQREMSTMADINHRLRSLGQDCQNVTLNFEVNATYSAINVTKTGLDVETVEIMNDVPNAYLVLLRPPTENLKITVNDFDRDVETLSGKELAIPLTLGLNVVQVHYAVSPILRIGLPIALLMGFVFLLYLSIILFRNNSQETEGGSLRN